MKFPWTKRKTVEPFKPTVEEEPSVEVRLYEKIRNAKREARIDAGIRLKKIINLMGPSSMPDGIILVTSSERDTVRILLEKTGKEYGEISIQDADLLASYFKMKYAIDNKKPGIRRVAFKLSLSIWNSICVMETMNSKLSSEDEMMISISHQYEFETDKPLKFNGIFRLPSTLEIGTINKDDGTSKQIIYPRPSFITSLMMPGILRNASKDIPGSFRPFIPWNQTDISKFISYSEKWLELNEDVANYIRTSQNELNAFKKEKKIY